MCSLAFVFVSPATFLPYTSRNWRLTFVSSAASVFVLNAYRKGISSANVSVSTAWVSNQRLINVKIYAMLVITSRQNWGSADVVNISAMDAIIRLWSWVNKIKFFLVLRANTFDFIFVLIFHFMKKIQYSMIIHNHSLIFNLRFHKNFSK